MSNSKSNQIARTREYKRAQRRKQQIRVLGFGVLVLVVFGTAVFFLLPLFSSGPSGVAQTESGKVVNVQAAMDGFDVREIRAKVGEAVTVNLRSLDNSMHTDGGGKHQFAIDELGVNIITPPLSTDSATFTPTQAGTYTYYCDICCGGKANPTMVGTLIVES